ncbi:MAG: ATP-binding protein, partial [Bacteroidales bacterium]|nr:ATP-binding protein [Bacteroidales bacterium]
MLKVLPEHIYSLIAAGEVIQRPASVVKELMENSADAGATSIMLVVSDYGKTLIQVIDNGCGMTSEEAGLCFLSHATSKIDSVEDLQNLSTFGFRGEALASIAACADVTLKTRKRGLETGAEVHISGGKVLETTEIACPEGCNIAVRNL